MNPYGITGTSLDPRALKAWTAANERARREYQREPELGIECSTGRCTEHTACWICRKRAKNLLPAATNEEECAVLLAVLDKPFTPRIDAAQCGTPSGQRAHLARGEKVCEPCRAAHNADQRAWRERRRKGGAA